MKRYATSPIEIARSLWRNRHLVYELTKREVIGRYRGSIMGLLWSFFNPVFMLCVYTFVFSVVFKARWNAGSDSKTEFALILFAGLIVFTIFSECINRAPNIVLENSNYVKKVVFPLEILPWITLGTVCFHACISIGVWLLAYIVFFGIPHITVLLLPLVLLPVIFIILGLAWALASLGVYLRDVAQVTGIMTTVLMFLSPIFYPVAAIPESYRSFLLLNPLAPAIEQTRKVLFWGIVPSFTEWLAYLGVSLFVAWLGFLWFQKTRKGFADVI